MKPFNPKEYKLVSLRECPLPAEMQLCDTPDKVVDYWNAAIKSSPLFNPECECFFALLLNTRRRVKAHVLVAHGTLDTILVHPREVFRAAITANASAIVLAHNDTIGKATHSEAAMKVTRSLFRAGTLRKIAWETHALI